MEDFGIEVRIARYHNIYGPFGTFDGGREKAPAALCRKVINSKLKNDKTIDVWGDGKQTRSFCYVSDLITALMMLMDSKISGPINLGNPNEIKIEDLAYLISNKINKKVDIHYKPALIDEPKERKPCIDLAKNVLNWQPSIDLDYGLDLTIKFYRKLIKA